MFSFIPIALILISIVLFLLMNPQFYYQTGWKKKVIAFGLPVLILSIYLTIEYGNSFTVYEIRNDISFILLLFTLYVLSGAIKLKGRLVGIPLLNVVILVIGLLLANFSLDFNFESPINPTHDLFGIIGSISSVIDNIFAYVGLSVHNTVNNLMNTMIISAFLLRPLIQVNQFRGIKVHTIIAFILITSHLAGIMIPLSDPPVFLGYLEGVPFLWSLKNIWLPWIITYAIFLSFYFLLDAYFYHKEKAKRFIQTVPDKHVDIRFKIEGAIQLIFMVGVIFSVYLNDYLYHQLDGWPKWGFREGTMLVILNLSRLTYRLKNKLSGS